VFEILIGAAAFIAGGIASIAGFGIGSILTPLLAVQAGASLSVAAVSIPHLVATAARFWMLRGNVNKRVLVNFGILSAGGGLAGALLHSVASNRALTFVFAVLLIFAGLTAITSYARRMRFDTTTAWVAGGISGMLGGLVGNQGGIRSAALLGFGLDRRSFVATATAIALVVDAARMPVYFATAGGGILSISRLVVISTVGVLAGTFLGARVLRRIPEDVFQRIVGAIVLVLGIFMLWQAFQAE
jgi:uncharacterized membrane protein YfcA